MFSVSKRYLSIALWIALYIGCLSHRSLAVVDPQKDSKKETHSWVTYIKESKGTFVLAAIGVVGLIVYMRSGGSSKGTMRLLKKKKIDLGNKTGSISDDKKPAFVLFKKNDNSGNIGDFEEAKQSIDSSLDMTIGTKNNFTGTSDVLYDEDPFMHDEKATESLETDFNSTERIIFHRNNQNITITSPFNGGFDDGGLSDNEVDELPNNVEKQSRTSTDDLPKGNGTKRLKEQWLQESKELASSSQIAKNGLTTIPGEKNKVSLISQDTSLFFACGEKELPYDLYDDEYSFDDKREVKEVLNQAIGRAKGVIDYLKIKPRPQNGISIGSFKETETDGDGFGTMKILCVYGKKSENNMETIENKYKAVFGEESDWNKVAKDLGKVDDNQFISIAWMKFVIKFGRDFIASDKDNKPLLLTFNDSKSNSTKVRYFGMPETLKTTTKQALCSSLFTLIDANCIDIMNRCDEESCYTENKDRFIIMLKPAGGKVNYAVFIACGYKEQELGLVKELLNNKNYNFVKFNERRAGTITLKIPKLSFKDVVLNLTPQLRGITTPNGILSKVETHLDFSLDESGAFGETHTVTGTARGERSSCLIPYIFDKHGYVIVGKKIKDEYITFGEFFIQEPGKRMFRE